LLYEVDAQSGYTRESLKYHGAELSKSVTSKQGVIG